jgi:hypothetical protein
MRPPKQTPPTRMGMVAGTIAFPMHPESTIFGFTLAGSCRDALETTANANFLIPLATNRPTRTTNGTSSLPTAASCFLPPTLLALDDFSTVDVANLETVRGRFRPIMAAGARLPVSAVFRANGAATMCCLAARLSPRISWWMSGKITLLAIPVVASPPPPLAVPLLDGKRRRKVHMGPRGIVP